MTNNILIRTVSQFPRKKLTRFKAFAFSPYFNKHQQVRTLIAYLSKVYPDFSEKKCNRETISRQLYPTLDFNPQKVAVIFTYAQRLLEQFLRVEEAVDGGLLENKGILIRHLRENNFLENINFYWKENYSGVSYKHNNIPRPTPTTEELGELKEYDEVAIRLSLFEHDYLRQRQPILDAFYLAEKLKDACELKQRSKLLNHDFAPSPTFRYFLTQFQIGKSGLHDFLTIGVFYSLYQLLSDNSPETFAEVKRLTEQHEPLLTQQEMQSIFNALQNFCIGQINSGHPDYLRELFEIYQSQLDKELLLIHGYLPEWHYKNIVTTALRLDEHQWAINFLNEFRELLEPNVRENAYCYNVAAYYYHLGNYQGVLQQLLQVEYTDLRYQLDAKSLLLRTYFDMEAEEALYSLADAFRQFLKRNKEMTAFQKTGYYNLLKFIRKIFKLKIEKEFTSEKKWQKDFLQIKINLDKTETVFNHSWLRRSMQELENN